MRSRASFSPATNILSVFSVALLACGGGASSASTASSCAALTSCCDLLPPAEKASCMATATVPGVTDTVCSMSLGALQAAGECGGASSGSGSGTVSGSRSSSASGTASPPSSACTSLAGCCVTLPAMEGPSECMVVVNDGTEGACSTTLMEYQSDGYCAGDAGTAECAGLALSYSPMYSAVIPGNVEQTFTVPVIVGNISAEDGVVFSSSSPSVTITPDPSTGGVLLTIGPTATAAPVTITATHDGDCGSASLHISVGTEAEWSAGSAIWNAPTSPDGGSPGCASCHSRSGSGGGFSDVTATPEQTAGFSDSQLLGIIENGQVPDGGYFDTTLITAAEFSRIHQFALSASDATGVVLYLRSLTPTPQMGSVSLEP